MFDRRSAWPLFWLLALAMFVVVTVVPRPGGGGGAWLLTALLLLIATIGALWGTPVRVRVDGSGVRLWFVWRQVAIPRHRAVVVNRSPSPYFSRISLRGWYVADRRVPRRRYPIAYRPGKLTALLAACRALHIDVRDPSSGHVGTVGRHHEHGRRYLSRLARK